MLVDQVSPLGNGNGATHAVVLEMRGELRELARTVERLARMVSLQHARLRALGTHRRLGIPQTPQAMERRLAEMLPDLPERELAVCARRVLGHTDSQIAGDLSIAETTVKTHTARLVRRFGLESARQLPHHCLAQLCEHLARELKDDIDSTFG